MADYKSILKGTLNSVTKKAKDYVESGKAREAYDKGSTAARCYANIAKLTLQINGELEEQNKVFTEIGRLCYSKMHDDPQGDFAPLFEELRQMDARIEHMREELEAAKAAVEAAKGDPNVDFSEFEVDDDE